MRFRRAGNAREQHSFPAEPLLQVLRAFLYGKPSGDLAHGGEKRQAPILLLQRLIGDRADPAREQRVHLLLVCREVQVGIEDEAVMEQGILALLRLLHLDHHIDIFPYLSRILCELCAGCDILTVRKAGADTGAAFKQHLMPGSNICLYIIGRKPHTVFVVFEFSDTTDLHIRIAPLSRPFRAAAAICRISAAALHHRTAPIQKRWFIIVQPKPVCQPLLSYFFVSCGMLSEDIVQIQHLQLLHSGIAYGIVYKNSFRLRYAFSSAARRRIYALIFKGGMYRGKEKHRLVKPQLCLYEDRLALCGKLYKGSGQVG